MYKAKKFTHLLNGNVTGINDDLMKIHFKLYEELVGATNVAVNELNKANKDGVKNMVIYSSIQKQFSLFFNGMRLHELYFGVMGGAKINSKYTNLSEALEKSLLNDIIKNFGSFDLWKKNFMSTGDIPGVGFAVLCYDKLSGKMFNTWINEFNIGELIEVEIILVMDMWEHAYLCEFGLDIKKYQETFLDNVNWKIVSDRYNECINESNSLSHKKKNITKKKKS